MGYGSAYGGTGSSLDAGWKRTLPRDEVGSEWHVPFHLRHKRYLRTYSLGNPGEPPGIGIDLPLLVDPWAGCIGEDTFAVLFPLGGR